MTYTADDVVLENISPNGNDSIQFSMYVQSSEIGLLNQQVLIQSIEVSMYRQNNV